MRRLRALTLQVVALFALFPFAAEAETPAQTLYLLHCSGCNGPDGSGDPRVDVAPFPDLIGQFLRDPEGRRYVTNVGGVVIVETRGCGSAEEADRRALDGSG